MTGRLLIGISIITTFTIGVGIIALPILVGLAGFWPGVIACAATWLYTLATALLYLEASLLFPDGANVYTISKALLGPIGTTLASASFIYVHFCFLTICYLFGAPLVTQILENTLGLHFPVWLLYVGLLVVCGGLVFLGMAWCARAVLLLSIFLLLFLLYILFNGPSHVFVDHYYRANWIYILFAIPSMYNAFYFQSIVPSLATFLKRDWVQLKRAIWIGSALAFIFFLFWLWLTVGLTTDLTITAAFETGQPLIEGIRVLGKTPYIGKATLYIAFCTLTASILVIGIANVDFYADLFGFPLLQRNGVKRLLITALFFIPPFILSLLAEFNIMNLLNATSGFALLATGAIVPLAWILSARYMQKKTYTPQLKIGRTAFLILLFATFAYLYLEGVLLIQLNIA